MRKSVCLWTLILFLAVGMAVAVSACGGSTAASSSTTLGSTSESSTAATGETTTTVTSEQTTTSVSAPGDTTTTTTEAAQTTDTADHAAEVRAQYPSTESFDNSNWTTLNAAPGSHLGAAVDVKGQPAKATVDPDSKYLTWQLTVSGTGGEQMTALCRTNVTVDRSLLSGGSPVEVKGLVVAAQGSDAGGGPIIYVESVQKAA
jgi:hypothetical protein